MTMHQLRVRVTVTTVHPGQDFGFVTVGADLVSVFLGLLLCLHRRWPQGSRTAPPRWRQPDLAAHSALWPRSWPSTYGLDSEAPNRQPVQTYDPRQFGN